MITTTASERLATMRHRLESAKAELESDRQDCRDMGIGLSTADYWLLDTIGDALSLLSEARPLHLAPTQPDVVIPLSALESLVDRTVGEAG